jgi:hypothetical protein
MPRKQTVKGTALSTVSPVSLDAIRAQYAEFVANNPDAQKALALASLLQPARAVRGARSTVSVAETEADRACRCAHFVSGNRRNLLSNCIAMLGDAAEVRITEKALSDATGLASYRVRPDMQTVQDRLNDTDNVAQFPNIREVGYKVHLAKEVRGVAREYVFSRVAHKAVAPVARKAKGKAVAPVAHKADTQEGK